MEPQGREYYTENYTEYERQNSARKMEFYLELVRTWAPPESRLFELGVGLGAFLARASREYDCSGCEVNAYGLAQARQRAPGATLLEGSYEQIPSTPRPDIVVAWDVLEHLPDLEAGLSGIRARLADPGYLIAVVPVYDGPLGAVVRALDRDRTHVSKWPRAAWLEALRRNGFSVLDWGGIVRRLLFGRFYLHVTGPRALLRRVGSAIWLVGGSGSAVRRQPAHARPAR